MFQSRNLYCVDDVEFVCSFLLVIPGIVDPILATALTVILYEPFLAEMRYVKSLISIQSLESCKMEIKLERMNSDFLIELW